MTIIKIEITFDTNYQRKKTKDVCLSTVGIAYESDLVGSAPYLNCFEDLFVARRQWEIKFLKEM